MVPDDLHQHPQNATLSNNGRRRKHEAVGCMVTIQDVPAVLCTFACYFTMFCSGAQVGNLSAAIASLGVEFAVPQTVLGELFTARGTGYGTGSGTGSGIGYGTGYGTGYDTGYGWRWLRCWVRTWSLSWMRRAISSLMALRFFGFVNSARLFEFGLLSSRPRR